MAVNDKGERLTFPRMIYGRVAYAIKQVPFLPFSKPWMLFLTEQQQAILVHIANGKCVKESALELNLSHKTIEFHYMKLREKLNIWTVAELTKLALYLGLTEPYQPNPEKEEVR